MPIIRYAFSSLAQNATTFIELQPNSYIEAISKVVTTDSSTGVDVGVTLLDQELDTSITNPIAECRLQDRVHVAELVRNPVLCIKNYAAAARSGYVLIKLQKKPYYNWEQQAK